jgi:hypothetical protein
VIQIRLQVDSNLILAFCFVLYSFEDVISVFGHIIYLEFFAKFWLYLDRCFHKLFWFVFYRPEDAPKYVFSSISKSSVSSINANDQIEINYPFNPVEKPKSCPAYLKF